MLVLISAIKSSYKKQKELFKWISKRMQEVAKQYEKGIEGRGGQQEEESTKLEDMM